MTNGLEENTDKEYQTALIWKKWAEKDWTIFNNMSMRYYKKSRLPRQEYKFLQQVYKLLPHEYKLLQQE